MVIIPDRAMLPKEEYKANKERERFESIITPQGCNIELEEDMYFIIHGQKLCLDLTMGEFKGHDIREYQYTEWEESKNPDVKGYIFPPKRYKYKYCHTCFKKTVPFCKRTKGRSNFPISGCDTYLYLFQDMTRERLG